MSKHVNDIVSHRKEFQLERLILFSDAVFAIAITLLVIEIKVPILADNTTHAVKEALNEKSREFFAFLLSFAVIGQFWVSHHRTFGYVTDYTSGLLWLNLHMLFWVVVVPFTSGLNSHYGNLNIVWMIYCLNMFMIALSLHFIYRYISNKKHQLSSFAVDPVMRKYSYQRSLITAFIFLAGALLCIPQSIITAWMARFIFFLIPIVLIVINKRLKKAQSSMAAGS